MPLASQGHAHFSSSQHCDVSQQLLAAKRSLDISTRCSILAALGNFCNSGHTSPLYICAASIPPAASMDLGSGCMKPAMSTFHQHVPQPSNKHGRFQKDSLIDPIAKEPAPGKLAKSHLALSLTPSPPHLRARHCSAISPNLRADDPKQN